MAIVNRDLDASQQRDILSTKLGTVVTGASAMLVPVGWPCTLQGYFAGGLGLSGNPTIQLQVIRNVSAGLTTLNIGTGGTLLAFGTSGINLHGYSGGVSFALLKDDLLSITTGTANTASLASMHAFVVQRAQDIVSSFGL